MDCLWRLTSRVMRTQSLTPLSSSSTGTATNSNPPDRQCNHKWEKEGEKEEQEKREREKGRKGERGKKEEGREAEEEEDKQVKKNVMDWTVVTRNRRQKKMIQIFVKVNGSKVTPMEVSMKDDKVEDVTSRIPTSEEVCATMHGRVLRRGEKLSSCGVSDGCTIQVTSRLRGGGGKHKDKKKSKAEKKQPASTRTTEQKFAEEIKSVKGPATRECDRDAAVRMFEENEQKRKVMVRMLEENDNRKMIESMSEGSDEDMERTLQNKRTTGY